MSADVRKAGASAIASYFDLKNPDLSESAYSVGSGRVPLQGRGSPLWAGQAVRVAILVRLWAKTPCPVQIRAPSVVSIMVRSHP